MKEYADLTPDLGYGMLKKSWCAACTSDGVTLTGPDFAHRLVLVAASLSLGSWQGQAHPE